MHACHRIRSIKERKRKRERRMSSSATGGPSEGGGGEREFQEIHRFFFDIIFDSFVYLTPIN